MTVLSDAPCNNLQGTERERGEHVHYVLLASPQRHQRNRGAVALVLAYALFQINNTSGSLRPVPFLRSRYTAVQP